MNPEIQILYLGVCKHTLLFWCQATSRLPPLRDCFLAFFEGFSKEIDHLSLVEFFALQNFLGKIWSLEFAASSSKSLEGFRKGLRKGSTRKEIEKQIQWTTKILDPWNPNTLFRGVQTYIIILMSGDFRATPFARLFFGIFWKGLVRKSTIWALLIFLHSRTFQARFGVWSLLLPAQRVLRASERVWERVQLGKELRNKFN